MTTSEYVRLNMQLIVRPVERQIVYAVYNQSTNLCVVYSMIAVMQACL